ncbi:MAG: hypothetical protein JNK47_07945 [Mesorhizobium sp.]|nr:hypothetical protein [Mesorhizobium sp.]MBL8577142.1 hypothetical protein [Mesorhizobium sp.]
MELNRLAGGASHGRCPTGSNGTAKIPSVTEPLSQILMDTIAAAPVWDEQKGVKVHDLVPPR